MTFQSGSTQCPKCGAVGTFKITLTNGGQVMTCRACHKTFTAEVKQGELTGKNR